ncbi:uncharacterized protein [Littorina saxatilis]|uniref:uncharacterized protein n=1 Tax=Littorina saxatilis TaxID=31220 RepID=UPI0038B4516C
MDAPSTSPPSSLPVTLKFTTLTLVATLTLHFVRSSPLPGSTRFYVDLNPYVAKNCDVISFVEHGFEVSGCSPTKNDTVWDDSLLQERSVCPWMTVRDEDPYRVPRLLFQAKCMCVHAQGTQSDQPCCRENHVTIPVVHCDKDPEAETPSVCRMTYKRVSDSCVCADTT